jgi:hypothetical protein
VNSFLKMAEWREPRRWGWGIPLKESPATRLSRCKHSLKKLQAIFCKSVIYLFIIGPIFRCDSQTLTAEREPITMSRSYT